MAKISTLSYVLTLKLRTEKWQEDNLNNKFESLRKIYNSCLGESLKRYRNMVESKEYQDILKCKDKNRNKKFQSCSKKFGLSKALIQRCATPMYNHFNIESKTAQNQSHRAFATIEKLMYHKAKRVNFIKYNELYSVEAGDNRQGIRYRDGVINWMDLKIPAIVKTNDLYAQKALQDRVKYCRILRREIKGKDRFYVQLILEGTPPMKVNKETGEIKNSVGVGKVGIDIGTQTIAIVSKYDVKLMELAPSIEISDKKIKFIQRKMDRSRRINNPNKYNENSTIKKGNRDKWIYSNRYLKLKALRKELFRKQTALRKQDHEIMANYIISLGDEIKVEEMNFKGLQARAKKTTVNEKTGKINKKKRFGKSLSNKAPSMLMTVIKRKLAYEKINLIEINTREVKASQFNHFTGEYHKKELKDRWNENIQIQRDLYSAFLIMNVMDDLKTIDRDLCFKTYDNFKQLHDKEINRLTELKNRGCKMLSSMGI